MTIGRLIFSCYNFFPGASTVVVKMAATGKEIYRGLCNDGFIRDFGDLKVIDFEIDTLKKNGVIVTMTIHATKEYAK